MSARDPQQTSYSSQAVLRVRQRRQRARSIQVSNFDQIGYCQKVHAGGAAGN
jgi:hypothetical protein